MISLTLIISIPIITAILGYLIPKLRNEFHYLGIFITLYYAFLLFFNLRKINTISKNLFNIKNITFAFNLDNLGSLFVLAVAIVIFLVLVFSFRFIRNWKNANNYYLYLSLAIGITNAMIMANNLFFYSILSMLLSFLLILFIFIDSNLNRNHTISIISQIALYDIIFIIGVFLLYYNKVDIALFSLSPSELSSFMPKFGIMLIVVSIFSKLGFIPFHSYINKISLQNSLPVYMIIPAILQKITNIYLLIRILYYTINFNQNNWLLIIMIIIGIINIIIASFTAFTSKTIYHLLNQNAIVQISLIVISISLLNPFGLVGGIYHVISYLTFQPSLLFTAGSFEYWTKNTYWGNYETLSFNMPITFILFILAILATVGIPPFSSFFSKWMIFEGILNFSTYKLLKILGIITFFIGLIVNPIYLLRFYDLLKRPKTQYSHRIRDPGFTMWIPSAMALSISLFLGIFINKISLQYLLQPIISNVLQRSIFFSINIYHSLKFEFSWITLLLIISFSIGIIIYYIKPINKKLRGV
ncbi:MAG: proton-conducting transporter membrane subunit [candidate division WOR-3 bacterium]